MPKAQSDPAACVVATRSAKAASARTRLPTTSRSLYEFNQHTPRFHGHHGWVALRSLGRFDSVPVPAEAVVEHRLGETGDDEPEPFAPA